MDNCKHFNFAAQVNVTRLTDEGDENVVVGYTTDITVKCNDCGLPFEFVGVPGGYSPNQPMVNFDGTTLRAPIKPTTDPVEHTNVILRGTN